MPEPSVEYEVSLREDLEDVGEAVAYLKAALADGSQEVLQLALGDVAASRGLLFSDSD